MRDEFIDRLIAAGAQGKRDGKTLKCLCCRSAIEKGGHASIGNLDLCMDCARKARCARIDGVEFALVIMLSPGAKPKYGDRDWVLDNSIGPGGVPARQLLKESPCGD